MNKSASLVQRVGSLMWRTCNRAPRAISRTAACLVTLVVAATGLVMSASAAYASPPDSLVRAVGQNEDGRLEVFADSPDGTIYHNFQHSDNGWDGWSSMGRPSPVVLTLEVASNKDGRLEVFVLTFNHTIYHAWQVAKNGPWSNWAVLNSAEQLDGFTVGTNGDGRLEVFAEAKGDLIHMWQTSPNGGWSGWANLGHPGIVFTLYGNPTVATNGDGRLEVAVTDRGLSFGEGSDIPSVAGRSWHIWQDGSTDNGFSPWASFSAPNGQGVAAQTLAANENKRLQVFALVPIVGTPVNGPSQLYSKFQGAETGNADGWSNWQFLGGASNIARLAIVSAMNNDGRLELFALDVEGRPVHMYQKSKNGEWTNWQQMSNMRFKYNIVAGKNRDGRLEVFVSGFDGKPYHAWQTRNGWSEFVPLESGRQDPWNVGDVHLMYGDSAGWHDPTTTLKATANMSAVNMGGTWPQVMTVRNGTLHQLYGDSSGWHDGDTGIPLPEDSHLSAVNMGGPWPQVMAIKNGTLHHIYGDSSGWHDGDTGIRMNSEPLSVAPLSAVNMGGPWPQVMALQDYKLHQIYGDSTGWHKADTGISLRGDALVSAVNMGGQWPQVMADDNNRLYQIFGDWAGWHKADTGVSTLGSLSMSAVNMGGPWPQVMTAEFGVVHQIYGDWNGWHKGNTGIRADNVSAVNMGGQWPRVMTLKFAS